eukprot:TRINITY_DN3998_c0_g1_i1.p1 TRINITY_DN3998_c0_g1~~TRINITY_DN3998_c0_g1_i1.p1  ORF type:complete len:121 (-),score=5.95 TRINITY_DN3998_c0_g1_i1:149-511(-)
MKQKKAREEQSTSKTSKKKRNFFSFIPGVEGLKGNKNVRTNKRRVKKKGGCSTTLMATSDCKLPLFFSDLFSFFVLNLMLVLFPLFIFYSLFFLSFQKSFFFLSIFSLVDLPLSRLPITK